MSRFTEKMYRSAHTTGRGMVTGEPHAPVRHTWGEVHERAKRIAGGLAAAGVGLGDAVGVLAGFPVEIAPTAQGLWMRGASLTMLHQPTPRTDLVVWAEDTMNVIGMIEAKAVIVSEPFLVAIPVLEEKGIKVLTVTDLLNSDPVEPIEVGEDDLALMQLTSGSTGSPKAVQITHRNIYSNAEAMFIGAEYDVDKDVMVSWLPCFHDMGMVGFLTIPMYFGAELVKVTPMDFLRDTLLWAKLIDKYKGTMTAAPNFAYALLAKRLRRQAKPGEFDLSTLRFALSGAEPVEPADVEDLLDAGKPFGLDPGAILPAYGMAETTLAVSFSPCGAGLVVDEVDMMGTVGLVDAALPHLLASDAGSIVTISSVSGREIDFAAGPYGTMKAAIIHYTQGLAFKLAGQGVRANTVSPGNTYFPGGVWPTIERNDPELFASALALNPTGRMATPQEVANAVVFLSSPAAGFITGTNLLVDGALTRGVQL